MEPACAHGDDCAGCPLLGLPYARQLEHKGGALTRALAPYPSLSQIPVAPVRAAEPPIRYRRRAKWMVDDAGALGLYARDGSFRVVDIPHCQVVDATVTEVGDALRALLSPTRHPGLVGLKAVDLRALHGAAPSAFVTLVFVRDQKPSSRAIADAARTLAKRAPVTSVFVNEVAPDAVQVLGPRTVTVWGPQEADDCFAGARLRVAPGSFVQAHEGQSRAVVASLLEQSARLAHEAGRPARVLDLFAGSGMWSLPLARSGAEVLAVESFEPAATRIAAAARAEELHVEALAEPAEKATRALVARGARFDLVVVNPPRRGLSPDLRAALAALRAPALAYLSCDPGTLSRDLDDLARRGIGASLLSPLDMIPLTDHVETLASLEPSSAPPALALARSPWGAAYVKAGHEEPLELLGRRTSPQTAQSTIVFAPAIEQSGVMLVADGAVPYELAHAEATLLLAVQGVSRAKSRVRDRGRGGLSLRRLAVGAGHSLVEVRCALADVDRVGPLLARIGHPPLGGAHASPRARRHVEERYGLDRAFFHVTRVTVGEQSFEAPLAPDLAAVGARLGFDGRNAPDTHRE